MQNSSKELSAELIIYELLGPEDPTPPLESKMPKTVIITKDPSKVRL